MNDIPKANDFTTGQSKKPRMFVYALALIAGVLFWTVEFRLSSGLESDSDSTDAREMTSNAVPTFYAASNRLLSVVTSVDSDKLEAVGSPSEHPFDNPAIRKARKHGALACVTVKAVDDSGTPLPDADVEAFFYVLDKQPNKRTGKTDSSGRLTVRANATWDVRCFVRKEGYYDGIGTHYLQHDLHVGSVRNGRWQPWNPEIEVVLKKKGKSANSLRSRTFPLVLPSSDAWYGFDMISESLVAPYGTGTVASIRFCFTNAVVRGGDGTDVSYPAFLVDFPGTGTGLLPYIKDNRSEASHPLFAPSDGYVPFMSFGSRHPVSAEIVHFQCPALADVGYLFSIRDANDRLHYGLVQFLTFIKGKRWIGFTYSVNLDPDNCNLEGMVP